ncbi:dihydroxyacetone kinase subunit DhaK [Peptostreptococcus russellii]|uniref:phosphoenolpyruvate--glycerone phosphotransferase n=1 Tax=Peptostreptococcus russellii TaxID=215200 RepID=A0A1H8G6E8_9FIRM|nr:dihydroxyacetone kinase subunit DhaK [Peptostreptococcus russellii]SEN39592.1 homodimeric dihydroxyacetone kinase [Peptostreptococcus russellii]
MKKIINKAETVVIEMCNGMAMAHPELEFVQKYKILKKKDINKNKVSLISGGGSGHEPAHAGFIGKGMLDAAVCGDIFASPSQIQIYKAIKKTASDEGTLLIIKNYSGDMMNFKNAAHLAEEDGIKVDFVKVDDDIAVNDSLYTVGRRGVAGTVLVHKVAGAAAEKGMKLEEVKAAAENAIANVRSIGFAFSSCTVPAKGTPTFDIADDEMEYGVGIHGEPGIKREKVISADEIAERMVTSLIKELNLKSGDEATLLVNGFGATPLQELYLLNNSVTRVLSEKNIKVYRTFVGNYMTSIDMAGASVSLLKMDDQLKELIDSESNTPAFKVDGPVESIPYVNMKLNDQQNVEVSHEMTIDQSHAKIENNKISLNNMKYIVDKMSECIIKNEVPFCELDAHAGDGDFGMSVAKGFKQLKREWQDILANCSNNIGEFLDACSMVIMEYCGGASGPIWGSAFRSAGKKVGDKIELTSKDFADMMQAAVSGVQKTGERSFGRGAVVGDKTLVDALAPCADKIAELANDDSMDIIEILKEGAKAAVEGAKSTEKIAARMGRAGTVGDRSIGYPDAGAYGLGVIFTEVSESLN